MSQAASGPAPTFVASLGRVPLAPVAIAFAVGIALAPWLRLEALWAPWLFATVAGAAFVLFGRVTAAAILLALGAAACGAIRATSPPLAPDHVSRLALPLRAQVVARVTAEPIRVGSDRLRMLVDVERVENESRSGRVLVTLYGVPPTLATGQQLSGELTLRQAAGFRNPGTFDYAAHLARDGIHVVASGRGDRVVALDTPAPPWPVRVRRAARDAMERVLPPVSAALLGGLLLGERGDLPGEISDDFRRAGVYHVLAVSGFNVAIVAGAAFTLLTLARAGRHAAALGAIMVVIGFAMVVGLEPSVVRAAIMGVLILGSLVVERDASVLNSLALAAVVVLAARPADLHDPGFQLSFAATAGIVLAPLPRGTIAAAFAVSLAAQAAVLPITLAHFNQVSLIGPVANLGVVPLAGVATVIGLLGVAISFVTAAVGEALFNATWPLLLAIRAIVALAAAAPGALVYLPAPGPVAISSYSAGLALALLWWRHRRERPRGAAFAGAGAILLLVLAIAVAAWPMARPRDGKLRLTFLDVGQGDAIVLESPRGRAAVIDAGAGGPYRLDAGEHVVAPFLWNRGFLRLAGAVTTHDDQDHAGGMKAIRQRFTVTGSWDFATTAEDDVRWLDGLMVSILSPRFGSWAKRRNDDAMVLRLDYGLASFLLTSDITAARELELVKSGAPLGATVLKVAHHGSRGSSATEFLSVVQPTFAVISVGVRNPYGHPSPETLGRLATTGARTYRTDRDGAVLVETDGRALTVRGWASARVDRYCLDPEANC